MENPGKSCRLQGKFVEKASLTCLRRMFRNISKSIEKLTKEELEELLTFLTEDDEEEPHLSLWTLEKFTVFQLVQVLENMIIKYDLVME